MPRQGWFGLSGLQEMRLCCRHDLDRIRWRNHDPVALIGPAANQFQLFRANCRELKAGAEAVLVADAGAGLDQLRGVGSWNSTPIVSPGYKSPESTTLMPPTPASTMRPGRFCGMPERRTVTSTGQVSSERECRRRKGICRGTAAMKALLFPPKLNAQKLNKKDPSAGLGRLVTVHSGLLNLRTFKIPR